MGFNSGLKGLNRISGVLQYQNGPGETGYEKRKLDSYFSFFKPTFAHTLCVASIISCFSYMFRPLTDCCVSCYLMMAVSR